MIIPESYYSNPDTIAISRDLLGKFLITNFGEGLTTGMIVETEAYLGKDDKACHAYGGRHTNRTQTMYLPGGRAYVYLCYGIHHLFNVVTNIEGEPHAVLIRAVEPIEGIGIMITRRSKKKLERSLTAGPGAASAALGIKTDHSGHLLMDTPIWIEDRGIEIKAQNIIASARVGVGYAGEDALLPYRFRIADSKWTSPAK